LLIDYESSLDENLNNLHQKHPPMKRKRYAATLAQAVTTLRNKRNLPAARMLSPLQYLTEKTLALTVAHRIVKDAFLEDIPVVVDIEQGRWTSETLLVRHYDFGKDLSLSELRLLQQIAKVAAQKEGGAISYTLEALRFSVAADPKARKFVMPEFSQAIEHDTDLTEDTGLDIAWRNPLAFPDQEIYRATRRAVLEGLLLNPALTRRYGKAKIRAALKELDA